MFASPSQSPRRQNRYIPSDAFYYATPSDPRNRNICVFPYQCVKRFPMHLSEKQSPLLLAALPEHSGIEENQI
jgi:hypothetical protein